MGKMGSYDVYDYTRDNIKPVVKMPVMKSVCDGDVFDLGGGRKIECITTPGHTPGGVCFLDETERILYCGDTFNTNVLALWTSMNTTLAGLYKVKSFEDRYDRTWNGHLGYAGAPTCTSQDPATLDNCIHICELVMEGKAVPETVHFLNRDMTSMFYGNARVCWDPEHIIDDGEKRVH